MAPIHVIIAITFHVLCKDYYETSRNLNTGHGYGWYLQYNYSIMLT